MGGRRLGDVLTERSATATVGRERELAWLAGALTPGPGSPLVWHVHGLAGIGKSSLLAAFLVQARAAGARVAALDCRTIEPTERGLLRALGDVLGEPVVTIDAVAARLERQAQPWLLAFDHYEVFRLLDAWLRDRLLPALPAHVSTVIASREPPTAPWSRLPAWRDSLSVLPLGPLPEAAALALLARAGIDGEAATRLNRLVRGHPLALQLAAATAAEPRLDRREIAVHRIVAVLARAYLDDIADPATRRAIEAASVTRRVTRSLLRAMLPELPAHETFDRLRGLPFAELGDDGLFIDDAVREAVAVALRAEAPASYRGYCLAAWQCLRAELRAASPGDLWRYTADMLYLIECPAVREGFFPQGRCDMVVVPAEPGHGPAIADIAGRHDGPAAARHLLGWWRAAPAAFTVALSPVGEVAGFACLIDPSTVPARLLEGDPLTRRWLEHQRGRPADAGGRTLLLRRWLDRAVGEAPSAAQAALWLDIKRVYLTLRPALQRVYAALRDPAPYAATVAYLGFQAVPEATLRLDGAEWHTQRLDFGPASVDGWLTRLAGAGLGAEPGDLLDRDARELVVGDHRVPLTRLEFAVLAHLAERPGRAASRVELLETAWGYSAPAGGSNVVDVVIRSLRQKLGEHAGTLETVRGVGYRYRPHAG